MNNVKVSIFEIANIPVTPETIAKIKQKCDYLRNDYERNNNIISPGINT